MIRTWFIDYDREELVKTRPHNEKVIWKLPLDIVKRIESVKDFEDVDWHFTKTVRPHKTLDEINKMNNDELEEFVNEDYTLLIPNEEYERVKYLNKLYIDYIKTGNCCGGYYDKENAKRIFGDYWNNEKVLEI